VLDVASNVDATASRQRIALDQRVPGDDIPIWRLIVRHAPNADRLPDTDTLIAVA